MRKSNPAENIRTELSTCTHHKLHQAEAVRKGEEIGDPWFDDEGATYSDTFGSKQPDPDRNPNMYGEQDKTFVPDDNKDLQGKATRVVKEVLDEGTTNSQVLIHRQIERMADGSESLYKFIKESATISGILITVNKKWLDETLKKSLKHISWDEGPTWCFT